MKLEDSSSRFERDKYFDPYQYRDKSPVMYPGEPEQKFTKFKTLFLSATPFRPFVAISTSVGAEGLDFHFYCNRLIHCTLPPNAIKLEQMNGRIDRMNSHAVRRWWSDPERYWDAFLREDLVNQSGGLSPYWDYGNNELHYYYLYMMGTSEKDRLDALLSSREAFRKKPGTWQDDIDGAVNLCPFLKRTK